MNKITKKILLSFITIMLSVSVLRAESWDIYTKSGTITPNKPYIELDMRWFEWYTSNSWMESCVITFSGYNDVVSLSDLCNGDSGRASSIRDDNDTYKTYTTTNFFVELWDPYTEHGDKYNYRVTIRILPRFPIEENMRVKGNVSCKWRDNHDGPYDKSYDFVSSVDGEGIFQKLGNITRNSNKVKYNNTNLADVDGDFYGYSRSLTIKTGSNNAVFSIPKSNTSYSTEVYLSSNRSNYEVTEIIAMEYNSFYLGEAYHTVSFVSKQTKSFDGNSYPTTVTVEADKWNKSVKLKWSKYNTGLSANGTWEIIRKDVEAGTETTLESGLGFGTNSYDDTEAEYDTKYVYTVAFMPDGWDGAVCSDLSVKSDEVVVNKDFKISLSTKSAEDNITLSWTHEALSGSWNYSYKVMKRLNNNTEWNVIKEERNLSKNVTKYSYKDSNIGSQCDINNYRIEMIALNNETFYSNEVNAKITGSTDVTSFSASRGDYSGNVKLSWNVEQVGTNATKFRLYRQLLGSDSSNEWKMIHETEGTFSVYTYDDITANTGQYYRYKLNVQADCENGYDLGKDLYTDGFSLATGIISGRVTYGTGTAVEGVKVSAIKSSDDDNSNEQFYSLNIDKSGGIITPLNYETAKNIFDGNFSVQAWVNLDTVYDVDTQIEEPVIAQVPNLFKFTAKKQNNGGFRLNVSTYNNSEFEDHLSEISIEADKFYHLTLSYDNKTKKMTLYSIGTDTITTDELSVNYTFDESVIIDTTILDKSQMEHFKDFHGKTLIAFGACMQDSTHHYFKGYIDEIRVWKKSMTLEEIKKNYDYVLAGTEKNLKIYYPLDEGINGQEIAYDYSKTDGVPNSLHGGIVPGTFVTTYHSSLLGLHAYTDTTGNYTIRGIPFRGTGTNYNVVPTYGIHEFSPNADARYVSSSSLNFSSVNFEDISSFSVSGVVYYENTTYPVAGASLYVDNVMAVKDNKPVVTNANGEFTISVPIGDHFITVKRDRHTFVNEGRYPADPDTVNAKFTFDREIKDLTFYDNTKAMFAGRVVGGDVELNKPLGGGVSKANIGQAKITFSTPYKMNVKKVTEGGAVRYVTNTDTLYYNTENAPYVNSRAFAGNTEETVNSITIFTDPETGEFAVELPPVEYTVDSARILTNDEIIFPELPTFVKSSNELIDYRDTSYVDVAFYEMDTIYENNDTIIKLVEKEEYVEARPFKYNASLLLPYRSEPVFEVTEHENGIFGIDTAYCVEPNGNKIPVVVYELDESNNVNYNYGHPIYETYGSYSYDIMAYEEYVNYDGETPEYDRVPLAGTVVKIQNEFAAGNTISTQGDNDGEIVDLAENELELDSVGYARYEFMGGAPNIMAPYTLSLNMSYEVNGKHYDWDRNGDFKAIILGNLPTGNNFVTAGPDQVQMILRDPPGSNSYSYWEEGTTHVNTHNFGGQYVGGSYTKFDVGVGIGRSVAMGAPGFYTVAGFKYVNEHVPGIDLNVNLVAHDRYTTSWTATKMISTSSDHNFVGAEGDVFIGSSTNVIFGDSREVGFHRDKNTNEIVLNMENCTTVGEEFTTGFNYTQYYIESTLIPNTIKLRDALLLPVGTSGFEPKGDTIYYISKLPTTDSKYGSSNTDSSIWGELAGTKSVDYGTYTLVEGPSYDILYDHNYYNNQENINGTINSLPQDQVNYYNQSVYNWKNILKENEKAKIVAMSGEVENVSVDGGTIYENRYTTSDINGWDANFDFIVDIFVDHNFGIMAENTHSLIINHGISFGGGGDLYWEETDEETETKGYVISDGDFTDALSVDIHKDKFGAIFRTRGGQTSCPYEDAVLSEYYQPGNVLSEATMKVEYPQITADVMMLSNVPSGSAAIFNINLANISESDTDGWYSLSVVDRSNPDGALVSVDNLSIASGRPIFLEADSVMTKQLTIKQTDLSILDYEDIKVVLSSQCQNDPSGVYGAVADTLSLTVHFVPSCSPIDIHIDNRVLNMNSPELTVKVDGYDLNYKSLKGINIQIKGEHDNSWTNLKSYVTDPDYLTPDVELLSSSEIIYTDALTNLSDQNYLVRAITLCEYGEETINNESEEILIIKDKLAPALIATPNPADGILSAGDEVSIIFNENVKSTEITEVDNIYVKAILNESEIAHSVAYATNASHPAKTESHIDLNSQSFTIEMWIKYSSAGTILTHGTADNKFVIAVDDDACLNITVNDKSMKSLKTLPKDKWTYLAVAVNQGSDFATLSAVCAYDEFEDNLFVDETAPLYKGNGVITVGEGLEADIHELTLWNYARTSSESLSDIYLTKSPFTQGLIGYWKLNEGYGTMARDYVRNRHLIISGDNSWYLENENKALEIDGNNYVAMNVVHCPTNADDNYLIEFWFKGEKQDGVATLLSMSNNNNIFDIRFNTNGYLEVATSQEAYSNSYKNYLDNNWHHLALNVLKANHSSAIVYIDGENVVQIDADEFPAIQTDKLIFGAYCHDYEYAQYFKGAFDEIRYWKGTYTAEYIKNNMYSRVPSDEQGLMAYYPLEMMSVDAYNQVVYSATLEDQSGNDAVENTSLVVYEVVATDVSQASTEVEPQWIDNTPPLKVAPIYDNVDVSFVASERKILINIEEDPKRVEGCTLIFNVSGIRDANDNIMNPVTWSAYVRQNQLNWSTPEINMRKQYDVTEHFSVKINNASANTEYWSIQDLPAWLDADIKSGDLAPLSDVTVNFTISDATAIGRYETVLYLLGNNAIPEPLYINLVCEGESPDWNVNPNDYASSMNLVAQLVIDGSVSDNPDDVVSAFINNVCVGVASPVYNSRYDAYYLMMNIYGNYINNDDESVSDEGAFVNFKVYDASTGKTYPMVDVSEKIVFMSDNTVGKLDDPVILSPSVAVQQTIHLAQGWSWVSINVKPEDNSVATVMEPAAGNVSYIKSKGEYALYENGEWHGLMSEIAHSRMYKIKTNSELTLDVVGNPLSSGDDTLAIYSGWTWIGYNASVIMSLDDAFTNLNPLENDMIKSRDGFAVFDGYEWIGTLTSMQPGLGYVYRSNSEETKKFTYPFAVKSSRNANNVVSSFPSACEYPDNMNVIAQVKYGDLIIENAVVEVFANKSLRGVSEQTVVEDKHFLTVYGNSSDDNLSFFVTINGNKYEIEAAFNFENDAVVGTLDNPYIIQIDDDVIENEVDVYPTLVKNVLNISSAEVIDAITIHNVSGLKVYNSEEHCTSTQINVEFLNEGVYIVTVTTENGDISVTYIVKG